MNLNYRLGPFSRRTLRSLSRAIAPVELGIRGLEERVLNDIERQLRHFPRLHRWGFIVGLCFVEWGAPLGGWGLLPLSLLKRDQATARLYKLLHSRVTPVRLFANGARVLVSLSAYGHPKVEEHFSFERLRWRAQRRATREALLERDQLSLTIHDEVIGAQHLPPTPETLYTPLDEGQVPLLGWNAHQEISHRPTPDVNASPFDIEDFVDGARSSEGGVDVDPV